jgi:hypothetical protein
VDEFVAAWWWSRGALRCEIEFRQSELRPKPMNICKVKGCLIAFN